MQSLTACIVKGDALRSAVLCPPGVDGNEWIAMNTVELYNTTMLCYSVVSEVCTPARCPTMSAGARYEYRWPVAGPKGKEVATAMPAQEYVENLAEWAYGVLSDPGVFVKDGEPYPKGFLPAVRKVLGRLFRVFGHVYNCHWEDVRRAGAEAHVNTSFRHFYFFVASQRLLDKRDMEPLAAVIAKIEAEA